MDPAIPFSTFAALAPQPPLRAAISAATRRPETECVPPLVEAARMPLAESEAAVALARRLAQALRERRIAAGREGLVQGLMQEFSLSSDEGVALMCVAEALLRIPDPETRQALIRDKVSRGDWRAHLGHSPSPFVNAAAWGLLLTGRLVSTHSEAGLASALGRIVARGGEGLVRRAVEIAMRVMGEQFVTGETIDEALVNARRYEAKGFRYSYDMLGEAAVTAVDAARYAQSYEDAIHAIGAVAQRRGVLLGPGISVKLSALHPRFVPAQRERVVDELYPRLASLAGLARAYDIGINVDTEEASRLELSLDLLERLAFEPALSGWSGIGFVVQAYQKRAPFVIDWMVDLARRTGRRLMVRLVKGAYWDAEIKRAQVDGVDGYPVYTRKAYTDVGYLACARKLLAAPDAIYPQFATHNAHTLAAVYHLAGPRFRPGQYEFQCLHGMGEPLYELVVGPESEGKLDRPCRIYAPVGTHETLLAYLVRRLLENGANTSFVNQVSAPSVDLDALVADPVACVEAMGREEGRLGLPHPRIPLPRDLFRPLRPNSRGLDLADEDVLRALAGPLTASPSHERLAAPTLGDEATNGDLPRLPARVDADQLFAAPSVPAVVEPIGDEATGVQGPPDGSSKPAARNPARPGDVVGRVREATADEVDRSIAVAVDGFRRWREVPPAGRAAVLERAADALEAEMPPLLALIVREAARTLPDAVAEVREAVDFLRYYAAQVRTSFDNATHAPLGPIACVSPWNFPLAIFTGQVAAALAAGNSVLAKPAEQTPLIAAEAVRLLHQAGVPRDALLLVPGRGETAGAQLVADRRIEAVVFTGSTDVARIIERSLARRLGASGRPVPLIAETGGQNAMIVDSSALPEQAIADAVASAFDSAGQRCSSLRVLCVQHEVADRIVAMLRGAMGELAMGAPDDLAVDVGPLIDDDAARGVRAHVDAMRARGHAVHQSGRTLPAATDPSATSFVPPTLVEIDRLDELEREVFGPVLHVVRFARVRLDELLDGINALGYGLTLGIHSRIDETIDRVVRRARVGNVYVNRNLIGAVVGVQPFGGEGLSGTGPKAGGPLYLYRLLSAYPADATGVPGVGRGASGSRPMSVLPGPTGERNTWSLAARSPILCLADDPADLEAQLRVVRSIGARAVCERARIEPMLPALPADLRAIVDRVDDWQDPAVRFEAVIRHGDARGLGEVLRALAERPGPIVGVDAYPAGDRALRVERLLLERVVSTNTTAAGGNASLMTMA